MKSRRRQPQAFSYPSAEAGHSLSGFGKHPDRNLEEVLHVGPDLKRGHRSRQSRAPHEPHRIIEQNFVTTHLHK